MSCTRTTTGRTLLKLLPLLAPFLLLFAGGLVMAVAQSFGFLLPFPYEGKPLDAYQILLTPHFLGSAGISLFVAFVSASFSVVIGTVLAYAVWRLPSKLEQAAVVYKVPLILPHIAVAFIVLVFWTKSGIIASFCHTLGLIDSMDQFPAILYGGGGGGMIIAYVWKEVPFMIILGYAVLKRLNPDLITAARMLGASEFTALRRVAVPHMKPAIHTAFIILFLYTFGAFDIPFLLAESSPSMLPIEVYNLYFKRELVDRPAAMAILTVMFLFSAAFIVFYTRLAARLEARERKL